MENTKQVKIFFKLNDEGAETESTWATQIAPNEYQIENSLFRAYGYSFKDIVQAEKDNKERLIVTDIVKRSGHSTYRIFLLGVQPIEMLEKWKKIQDLGCSYERASDSLYAIDIPPEVNVSDVYKLLEQGETEGVWEFEEGHSYKTTEI